jgi:hypothetical protein
MWKGGADLEEQPDEDEDDAPAGAARRIASGPALMACETSAEVDRPGIPIDQGRAEEEEGAGERAEEEVLQRGSWDSSRLRRASPVRM